MCVGVGAGAQFTAYLVSVAFQLRRARCVLGLAFLATLMTAGGASAQSPDESQPRGIFDEVRFGVLGHHIEPAGTEKGTTDLNFEILFSRPAIAYDSRLADIALRPRIHLGVSANLNGFTDQAYAGFTWTIPVLERFSLELTFGGSLNDGPSTGDGSAFGCPLNFRESASGGFALTERWRLYATVAHMSNAGLCVRNSGLTSGGVRLGYVFE
jgi:lipid A 3-O-deacylase